MATNILIYDIIRIAENQYKSHYRLYNEQKNLLKESDYVYTIIKPRNMRVGELKQKIKTGIWQQSWGLKIIDKNDKMITS